MDAHDDRDVVAHLGVVAGTRLVRRTDVDKSGTRLLDHLGDAKTPSDFDALPPRHGDAPAVTGERGGDEHDGRRIVVHDDGILGTDEDPQQLGDRGVARPPLSVTDVEFDVRRPEAVASSRAPRTDGGATEVRVQQHPRRIDDIVDERVGELPCERQCTGTRVATCGDCPACAIDEQGVCERHLCGDLTGERINGYMTRRSTQWIDRCHRCAGY